MVYKVQHETQYYSYTNERIYKEDHATGFQME